MSAGPVKVFEVGPRDGLQNEKSQVSLTDKLWFVRGLIEAGVREMELGAFVHTERVPQMADTDEIFTQIKNKELALGKAHAWALVPNRKGLERAIASGVRNIAIFTAATDGFNKANIGMTVAESLKEYRALVPEALKAKMQVRGYVSTTFGCPYEGNVAPKKALRVIETVAEMGVCELSIGDTIGVATPRGVLDVVKPAYKMLKKKTAVHFHDTRGTALANALQSLEIGVRVIDSSAGGLGGCPYAPGASGNLATEDLVYMLHGMGFKTGINLDRLSEISLQLASRMGRTITSKYVQAYAKGHSKK